MKTIQDHMRFIFFGLMLVATSVVPWRGVLAEERTLVVATWGGTAAESMKAAMFEPFEKETGIKIVQATLPSLVRVRAMVDNHNTEWDIASMVPGDALAAFKDGLLEKIDYSRFDQAILDDVDPRVRMPYGIGFGFYSKVLAFNTKRFP